MMPADSTRGTRTRRAFTLVEVLLVLGVVVLIAALAFPSMTGTLDRFRLRKAADQIRIQWQQARTQAIRSNCRCSFRYVPGGRHWAVQTVTQTETLVDPSSGQMLNSFGAAGSAGGLSDSQAHCGELPEGVRFAQLPAGRAGAGANTSPYGSRLPSDAMDGQLPLLDETEAGAGWSWPIYFYPDGTADSASICLENEKGRRVEVHLRGLTGVVTVGSSSAAEEGQP